MSLDGLAVRSLAIELQSLEGGRITKIHQPGDTDIVLHIRAQNRAVKLLLSVNPTYPRVHLTEASYRNPAEAPMFCMLMRKYCEGAILERIRQDGAERVLHFDVRHRDELGDVTYKRIVVELMGRHSNLILLDPETGLIHDGIRHVTPAVSSYRIVLPGSRYVAPPAQDKADPFAADAERFRSLMAASDGDRDAASGRFVRAFTGIGPLNAREICHRAGISGDAAVIGEADAERLWQSFRAAMLAIERGDVRPNIVREPGGKELFSVLELTHAQGERRTFPTVSACLEAYYGDKAERDAVKQRANDMIRLLQNERNKNEAKLAKLRETLEEAKEADRFRRLGELLTASLHEIEKGAEVYEAVDYYDEAMPKVAIPLDPRLTPSENAQRYFRKYAKAKNSLAVVAEQIARTQEENEYLDNLLAQLAIADLGDLEEIREELEREGYAKRRQRDGGKRGSGGKPGKKKKPEAPALTVFRSSEGVPILVGKNNTQNEYLTMRLAKPNETWLHTKDIPGSHVVIRSDKVSDTTLREAAVLAAWFSQARESSSVPVDYTLIRHVRKPNGARPGYVIYDRQRTLYVTPDEELVRSLAEPQASPKPSANSP
ncbi:NFACT family protein [Paenibacillus thermoaerophilus]|uniref:Rqc2 homolog RqcH n=1 Tax=Paenibacillus thermoaerophilus TaxID=1215385 RepID=A0ABW2UXW4_9BACL|nr:NFACT RNA binding domain-containing protein [Paenibacillus thermoaerophilus]TMV19141.1 fibronectin/fibrinogen-binding protein [Paenibacillus thermoaerophilus]